MDSSKTNDDITIIANSSTGSSSTTKLLLRFQDGTNVTIPIDSRLLSTDSDYNVDDLRKVIFEWSQEPTSGVFLTHDGFRLKIAGKRKQRVLSDGNIPLANIGLKEGTSVYIETVKRANVDESIFDNDESNDESSVDEQGSNEQYRKKGKTNHDKKSLKGPISISYDNAGDAKSLASIIINNGVIMNAEDMGFSRLGEYQLNMFTTAARIDSLKKGKLQITETDNVSTATGFVVNFESNNRKYCDKIERTMGMELMKSIAEEILNRTSTSRRRNKEGLKKVSINTRFDTMIHFC